MRKRERESKWKRGGGEREIGEEERGQQESLDRNMKKCHSVQHSLEQNVDNTQVRSKRTDSIVDGGVVCWLLSVPATC